MFKRVVFLQRLREAFKCRRRVETPPVQGHRALHKLGMPSNASTASCPLRDRDEPSTPPHFFRQEPAKPSEASPSSQNLSPTIRFRRRLQQMLDVLR
jgi:hypothetical protein